MRGLEPFCSGRDTAWSVALSRARPLDLHRRISETGATLGDLSGDCRPSARRGLRPARRVSQGSLFTASSLAAKASCLCQGRSLLGAEKGTGLNPIFN